MKNKTNRRCFIFNAALVLAGAVSYLAGVLSAVSVFLDSFSFPFPASERFVLGREFNFFVGVILFVLSQSLYLFFYEKNRTATGFSGAKTLLCSLLGPVTGFFVLVKYKSGVSLPGNTLFPAPVSRPVSKRRRLAGGAVFAGAVLFLAFLLFNLVSFEAYPRKDSAAQMGENERAAYRRLRQICDAQKQYIQTDWDKDGVFSYSLFLVNLWQTLDERVFPVTINLIPQELGYAMRRAHSLDGYFFVDIHRHGLGPDPENPEDTMNEDLDYRREFAMAAFPERYGETGRLSFLIDQTGEVRCFELTVIDDDSNIGLYVMPPPEELQAWQVLRNEEDLLKIQAAHPAPKEETE